MLVLVSSIVSFTNALESREDHPITSPLHKNELYPVTEFLRAGYSNCSLCCLNHIKKYFKVISLTDIVIFDDKAISCVAHICAARNGICLHVD